MPSIASGGAGLEVHAVGLVELRRLRVLRAGAVQRVEVEAGRARLQQRGRGDVRPEHHVRLVERQVVVDELAEVREARGDRRRLTAAAAISSPSFLRIARDGWRPVPFGPMRENRNGGAALAATASVRPSPLSPSKPSPRTK
jgi:hypothetical protein